MLTKTEQTQKAGGFALVELMVAISIIVILSVSLLFQQNKFDSSVQITNIAQEIKTVIQEAQRYGTSSLVGDLGSGFGDSYGVYFDLGNNETFILFRDLNNDGNYTSGELIEEYTISGKTVINQICTGTYLSCAGDGTLTIIFTRPDPEPSTAGWIRIENDSQKRDVVISRTGQIQVINN
jgi:prepilin-type N-terminal cleavage/methylation domain-containing protein